MRKDPKGVGFFIRFVGIMSLFLVFCGCCKGSGKYWNARVRFIFENADTLKGLFRVTDLGTARVN